MFAMTPWGRGSVRRREPETVRDLINDFFQDDFYPMRRYTRETFKLDVKDEGNAFIIEAELPGVKKENITLNYHDGLLDIAIEHQEEKEETDQNYLHRERRYRSMRRTLNLGELDESQIDARLEEGILTVKAPKKERVETTTKIEIK
ncbi:MAG: Hsp20 family protein [Acholeplasmataceae bacterium]|nr:Hsp20 family protein [Acholeplasmataceae bacterium]